MLIVSSTDDLLGVFGSRRRQTHLSGLDEKKWIDNNQLRPLAVPIQEYP